MKVRPILFDSMMVRALLAGNKTQTRRLLKPQPEQGPDGQYWWPCKAVESMVDIELLTEEHTDWKGFAASICPYGQIGDLLYVRETFRVSYHGGLGNNSDGMFETFGIQFTASPGIETRLHFNDGKPTEGTTDNVNHQQLYKLSNKEGNTPSIHMPRWASRLTLRISNVRVERLNDISSDDTQAEGVHGSTEVFKTIWQRLNGAGSWEQNPWVWVIEFSVIHKNVDQVIQETT